MNFAEQLRRAEQLAKSGGSLIIEEVSPKEREDFSKLWTPPERPKPEVYEVWIDMTYHYLDYDGVMANAPMGTLPYDDGIIDHGDGSCSIPAGSPRLRPYGSFELK